MIAQQERIAQAIDRLTARPDVWISRERIQSYLDSGAWTADSFVDLLDRHSREIPDRVAIIDDDGSRLTYAEFAEQARQFGLGLLDLGLQPGDRIGIQLPNWSEMLVAFMGANWAGMLPVLCHIPYREHDLTYALGLTEARAVVVPQVFKGYDHPALIERIRPSLPNLEHIIVVGHEFPAGAESFRGLINRPKHTPRARLDEVKPIGLDPFFVMFTSGTTGRPKAELHLHANNFFWVRTFQEELRFPSEEVWFVVTPLAHLTGLGIGILGALMRGAPVVILSAWNVNRALEVMGREQPDHLLGAAPMLVDLARHPDLEQYAKSLKTINYAGAPVPIEILRTLVQRLGTEIIAFYGYTEAGATHATRRGDPLEVTSVQFGKIFPGLSQKLVDDDGNELTPPAQGELWVSGPSFIPGYYGQPETTTRMFTPDGYFRSSDIVQMDEKGYCTFVSRRDDMINRGGYKIDPREIEELLYQHPDVAQVAVVAMPDERLGQRACAFVVPREGAHPTLDQLTAFLAEKGLTKAKWPERLELVDEFPMTSTGKFMRYALRDRVKTAEGEPARS